MQYQFDELTPEQIEQQRVLKRRWWPNPKPKSISEEPMSVEELIDYQSPKPPEGEGSIR